VEREIKMTSLTCLYIASKNSEVEPLCIGDIHKVLLRGEGWVAKNILDKEKQIRKSISYENEVTNLFENVLFFSKIWKMVTWSKINPQRRSKFLYIFLCEIESSVYDLSKSVLIDAELSQFKMSILICALFFAVIEVKIYLKYSKASLKKEPVDPRILKDLKFCISCFDELAKKIFGPKFLPCIREFG